MGKQIIRKKITRKSEAPREEKPGLDLLRELAGYPRRQVHMGKHQVKDHYVEVHRDALGRIIGHTEIRQETEFTDLDGDYYD